MSSSPTPASREDTFARPVDAGERVLLLDVLRAFALCGVFIANTYYHFSGRFYLPRGQAASLHSGWWDSTAAFLFDQLISEKAMTLFSFLFGMGFALQMMRAEERGRSIAPLYARRLGVLLLIGLTHLVAIWYGDILSIYAMMGFVLLLMRTLPDRNLLVWSAVLIFAVPLAFSLALKLLPLLASSSEIFAAANQEYQSRVWAVRRQTLEAFSSGSYLAVVRANIEFYLRVLMRPTTVSYMLFVLGRFLLGLLAGRHRLLQDVERHRPFFHKLLGWGLLAAVLGHGAQAFLGSGRASSPSTPGQWAWQLVQPSVWEMGVIGLASVYVASFALLFQRPRWRRVMAVLAPAGQMALTNYLCQSLINHFIYYGYGLKLIGKLGPASCMTLTFALFWVQVAVSHLWLARFRFGPVEWVWRSLTYGRFQPLRRGAERAGEDAASAA